MIIISIQGKNDTEKSKTILIMKVKDVIAAYQKLDPESDIWVCMDCGYELVPPIPGCIDAPEKCSKEEADIFNRNGNGFVKEGDYLIYVGMN